MVINEMALFKHIYTYVQTLVYSSIIHMVLKLFFLINSSKCYVPNNISYSLTDPCIWFSFFILVLCE